MSGAMATAKWMWGDAALLGHKAARLNPLRWSRTSSLEETIAELEQCRTALQEEQQEQRPVRVVLKGPGRHRPFTEERCHPDIDSAVNALRAQLPGAEAHGERPAADTSTKPTSDKTPDEGAGESKVNFRFQDRSAIPEALLEGPFEDLEVACDVYATAYLIARNATPEMYSFSPLKNPQVRIVWEFLLFIVGTQLFVIIMLTCMYPPSVNSQTWHVDCANATSLAALATRGVIDKPEADECRDAGRFAFEADVRGTTVRFYALESSTPFYNAILTQGTGMIYLLRLICCTWQFSQMYLQHFANLQSLLEYHDFSRWFLGVKGEDVRNAWVISIPLVQYTVLLVVTTVSFAVICAQDEAFDIVMNSLAFTFIAEVGSYFNGPLARKLATTKVVPPPYGMEMFYLYPEYSESNAIREDGTYTDRGWYICEDESKAGMLSDYKVRHNPAAYEHPTERLILVLKRALLAVPVAVVALGALRSHALQANGGSPGGSEL